MTAYQELIDIMPNHGFVQIVSRPTRVTDNSATLIDHVYTNKFDYTLSCNVLTIDISDHLATSTTIKIGSATELARIVDISPRNSHSESNKNSYRVFNEANDQNFKNITAAENLSALGIKHKP